MNILKFFLPKDPIFFSLFETAAHNNERIAAKLIELVHEPEREKKLIILNEIHEIEHQNDDISHQIFTELGRNFITPFDREDIHSLTLAMDDICDHIFDSAKKMVFYKVDTSDKGITRLAEIIHEAVLHVNQAIKELKNLKNTKKIVDCVIKINSAENRADEVFDMNIQRLFEEEEDAKEVIKRREIYQTMENATDKCEDVGNVIESIVVKYA